MTGAYYYERYVERSTTPEEVLAHSQDEIESQIEDYAREDALANNPDASEAEIAEFRAEVAHIIMSEAQRMIDARDE